MQALQEAGIAYDPDKVIWFYTEDRKTHPFERISRWRKIAAIIRLRRWWRTTIAANEVIRALNEEGLSVPQDVSGDGV